MKQRLSINPQSLISDFEDFKVNIQDNDGKIKEYSEKKYPVLRYQVSQYLNDTRIKEDTRKYIQELFLEMVVTSGNKKCPNLFYYNKIEILADQLIKEEKESDEQILSENLEYLDDLAILLIKATPEDCKSLNPVLRHLREFSDKKIPEFLKDSKAEKDDLHCQDRIEELVEFYSVMLTFCKNYINDKDLNSFKKNSQKAIKEAHITFDQHRGMKNFLCSLLLAVLTVGLSYFATAAYQKTFFPVIINTDSADWLDIIQSDAKAVHS